MTSKKEFSHKNSLLKFKIQDVPGQLDPAFESDAIWTEISTVLFVIDSQDDYIDALSKLFLTITKGNKHNPNINYEVFIHKVNLYCLMVLVGRSMVCQMITRLRRKEMFNSG
jgi:Ras-related GTP-binding protein C/D